MLERQSPSYSFKRVCAELRTALAARMIAQLLAARNALVAWRCDAVLYPCHQLLKHGYKMRQHVLNLDEIRGGIPVSIPMGSVLHLIEPVERARSPSDHVLPIEP